MDCEVVPGIVGITFEGPMAMQYGTLPERYIPLLCLALEYASEKTILRQAPSSITFEFAKNLSLELPVKHFYQQIELAPWEYNESS